MDEGLVVISAVDKSVTFASAPALQILKQLPRRESYLDSGEEKISSEVINR